MKKLGLSLSVVVLSAAVWAGCGGSKDGKGGTPAVLKEAHHLGSFSLSCGRNTGNLDFQMVTPAGWDGKLHAMLLNSSPGTNFVSHNVEVAIQMMTAAGRPEVEAVKSMEDPYKGLQQGLLKQGYRVLEVRYQNSSSPCGGDPTMDGFYALCCRQGLDNVKNHNAALYDAAVEKLGYDPANNEHRLIGFGVSLGGMQVESMAFITGKKFEKVGITGVLMGDSVAGCETGRGVSFNGMGWHSFMNFADAMTQSGRGCSQSSPLEFNRWDHNFEFFRHRARWDLGMFEGARRTPLPRETNPTDPIGIHGNDAQVDYIQERRRWPVRTAGREVVAQEAATTVHKYPNCGHEVLFCSGGEALRDILQYFDPARKGLDSGL